MSGFHDLKLRSPLRQQDISSKLGYKMTLCDSKKRVAVIGGVEAGASAASKARRIDPEANVKIIQEENVVSYGACGIPYVLTDNKR